MTTKRYDLLVKIQPSVLIVGFFLLSRTFRKIRIGIVTIIHNIYIYFFSNGVLYETRAG